MWASSMGATTSSETALAYSVTMSCKRYKKLLIISTCLMTRPLFQLYYPSGWREFFLNGPTYMQSWYEDISSLPLYFLNSQSVHILPIVVIVSPHNDLIRIFLQNAGTHMEGAIYGSRTGCFCKMLFNDVSCTY